MKFIDLFAGLGGFHLALSSLGLECVFACEIDENLRSLYKKNFGIEVDGDIKSIKPYEIPSHDVLCAGFPCQPFSKAGSQQGFNHPKIGSLYLDILRIIEYHHPTYIILENVPNLQTHGNGETWKTLEQLIRNQGYDVKIERLSPHQYGIPQKRDRIYIIGSLNGLDKFKWPDPLPITLKTSIFSILDNNPPKAKQLSTQVGECIQIWQEFVNSIPKSEEIPLPIWSMEFGATYPYKDKAPSQYTIDELQKHKGSFGIPLVNATNFDEVAALLPSHSRGSEEKFPLWKQKYIEQNREFYEKNRSWVEKWIPFIRKYPSSMQKFEWNCHGETNRNLKEYLIQLRPSGVRIKRTTMAPALVAMNVTQVPIIPWENRYMTLDECKRLQSMENLAYLPESNSKAFTALGNAVNVEVVRRIARNLIKAEEFIEINQSTIAKKKEAIC